MNVSTLPRRLGTFATAHARALQWLLYDRSRHYRALLHRRLLRKVVFVGITGSAGKTSTKDLAARILSTRGPCQSSRRSGNEHQPVDETVLSTQRRHRYAVVEMSASQPGYLDRSIRVVRPDIAVLTVIALEHYGAYRSLEAVAAEKRKIIDRLPDGGIAVLNRDDPLVRAIGESRTGPVIWVGTDEGATIRLLEVRSAWPDPLTLTVEHEGRRHEIVTCLHGTHLAVPLLCALGVGLAAGIALEEAIGSLAGMKAHTGRMQIETLGDGITFVRDDFKAPQWSLEAPLRFLRDARAQRKVAVIGTISDSPNDISRRYSKVARAALEIADLVLLVGSHTLSTERANRIRSDGSLRLFRSVREATAFLDEELRSGDLVLLKGTNKTDHLVRIVLARRQEVRCWESSCRRIAFCDECPRLHKAASAAGSVEAPASTPHRPAPPRAERVAIVVGLGNPGASYRHTVHNVGQIALDRLAEGFGATWTTTGHGEEATISVDGIRAVLVKLNQPMNRSGSGLKAYLGEFGHEVDDCVVVLDDADVPLGKARIRLAGGDAGHRGMRSILEALDTDRVCRVRIGVRGLEEDREAGRFVLSRVDAGGTEDLASGLATAERLLRKWIAERRQRDAAATDPVQSPNSP